jgi:large subunit ribosomal protein L23
MPSTIVHLPEMALTLVRRVTARLPYNHFLFRATPSVTKHEVREYLEKVYDVRVARVTTSVSLGKVRRVPGKNRMFRKLADYKRVMVRLADDNTFVDSAAAAAAAGAGSAAPPR